MQFKVLFTLFILISCKINFLFSLDQNVIADLSYNYFNKAFLIRQGSDGEDNDHTYYRTNLSTTHWLYFWQQALVVLMVCDRYEFRGDDSLGPLINDLVDAFFVHERSSSDWEHARQNKDFSKIAQEKGLSDWTWNDYNDDLLWAGLIFIRAYLITGKEIFLEQAKWDWDLLFTRGWSDDLGGGIWWSVKKEEKSGLSNNPAICMACYLYQATGDKKYLDQAIRIYDWVKSKLHNDDGSVDEKINADGSRPRSYNIYNQGTFVEGTALLYKITGEKKYLEDAQKTVEFVMVNRVTDKGIMSGWKTDGTLQSEFARGIARLLQVEPSLWKYKGIYTKQKKPITYFEWMRMNADAAWNTRDKVNNISGCKWEEETPTVPSQGKTWEADACVSAVIMINVTPEKMP
jgi:predicted alpha-1,6-mannanase (GH76 family)